MKSSSSGARLWTCLILLLAALLTGVGCQSTQQYTFADEAGSASTNAAATPAATPGGTSASAAQATQSTAPEQSQSPDLLHPGNKLTITFSGVPNPPMKHEEKIREDGSITPPLLGRPVPAAGRTVGQLQDELQKAYVPAYYKSLTVTVTTEERFFYVAGEVKAPGRLLYLSQMTVLRAIQAAGDFTDYSDRRRVQVIRANGKVEKIDCIKAVKDPRLDKPIYPDDTVRVPRRWM